MTIDPKDYDLDETVRLRTSKEQPERPFENKLGKLVAHGVEVLMKDPNRWGYITIAYRDKILSESQILALYEHIKNDADRA